MKIFAHGDEKTGTPGMDAIRVMNLEQIKNIPSDRVVTYARVVVDFRPQKKDPNRVRITAGGDLIAYPDELTTRTADLTVSKIPWNSVLSTNDARYATLDIANFYLGTPNALWQRGRTPVLQSLGTVFDSPLRKKEYFSFDQLRPALRRFGDASGLLALRAIQNFLAPLVVVVSVIAPLPGRLPGPIEGPL